MTTWSLSPSFAGFAIADATPVVVTLSTTLETTVDLQVSLTSLTGLPPAPCALGGGFKVLDANTGALATVAARVIQSTPDPGNPSVWNIRLLFAPDPGASQIRVRAYATYATFAAQP